MMPQNVLSDTPIQARYLLFPGEKRRTDLQDWALGGRFLADSQEAHSHLWSVYLQDGVIWGKRQDDDSPPVAILTPLPGVLWVSAAFDTNGRPTVAYQAGSNTYLYWFDTVANDFVTTIITDGLRPQLTFDDVRPEATGWSDVMLAYIKANRLTMRQQRDRYLVEYDLAPAPFTRLARIGLGNNYRMQFIFTVTGQYGSQ